MLGCIIKFLGREKKIDKKKEKINREGVEVEEEEEVTINRWHSSYVLAIARINSDVTKVCTI